MFRELMNACTQQEILHSNSICAICIKGTKTIGNDLVKKTYDSGFDLQLNQLSPQRNLELRILLLQYRSKVSFHHLERRVSFLMRLVSKKQDGS